jgi:hypothetical protein
LISRRGPSAPQGRPGRKKRAARPGAYKPACDKRPDRFGGMTELRRAAGLFVLEGGKRVDADGAPGWNVAGKKSDDD